MSRFAAMSLAFVAGAAACSDPVVSVRVSVPGGPDYMNELASLAVSVLAPEDDSIDCDAIAFGQIDDDLIALAEVTGVTLRREEVIGPVSIGGVPRLGRKLWLAEGRTADGDALIAGCTEQLDDIVDDTTIIIETVATAQIAVELHPPDEPVPAMFEVSVDDVLANPSALANREIRWEVHGPAGVMRASDPDEPALTSDSGLVTIEPASPPGWGPVSMQIRTRWARNNPAVVAGYQGGALAVMSINRACTGSPADILAVAPPDWHRLRVGGRNAIAGLAVDGTRYRLYAAAWDGNAAVDACSAALPAVPGMAVLRADATDPVDRLLIVTATEWIEHAVTSTGGPISLVARTPIPWTNPTGTTPLSVITMRACGRDDGAADYVLVQLANDTVLAFDTDGQPTVSPFAEQLTAHANDPEIAMFDPRPIQSGCIAQGSDEPALQAVLLASNRLIEGAPGGGPRILVVDAPDTHFAGMPVLSFGAVSFADVTIDEPLLLGGALDPSGAKVVRWRLSNGDDGLELHEEARDDSLGAAVSVAYGDLDGDDLHDTVWGLVDAFQGGPEESRIQVSLGCRAGELALNSVAPEVMVSGAAVFLDPDVADDRTADLMIGSSRQALFVDTDE